jgi:mono/diheme cytochrome c family protein
MTRPHLTLLTALLAACSNPAPAPRTTPPVEAAPPMDEDPIALDVALWRSDCVGCHGERAAFFASAERTADATMRAITSGTDAAPWHVFWHLGEDHRRALTKSLTGALPEGSPRELPLVTDRLNAELARVRALPDDRSDEATKAFVQSTCSACHGPAGRGDGAAADALGPRPRDWSTPVAARWRRAPNLSGVFTTLTLGVDGTAMASFSSYPTGVRWLVARHVVDRIPEAVRAPDEDFSELVGSYLDAAQPAQPAQLTTPATWAREQRARLTGADHDGEALYRQYCASCHGESGAGIPDVFPPLVAVPWTNDPARRVDHIEVILAGLQGKIRVGKKDYDGIMQPYYALLDDYQVAALATWVNAAWGNQGGPVTGQQVAAVRKKLGYPPFGSSLFFPDTSDAARLLATAPCRGCHGGEGPAPALGTYQGMTPARFAAALVSPGSTHPRHGASMEPGVFAGLVQIVTDASCGDLCARAQFDALSPP